MRIGLHLTHYGPAALTARLPLILRDLAAHAEDAGLHSLWLMDQLEPRFGPREDPMLEPYTTLAWIAAHTDHLQLGVLVSPPNMRDPRLLARTAQTLDLLSGSRAWLGLGAGSGPDRFTRLEQTLIMINRAFDEAPAPRADPTRRVPVLIAGGGPRRTLPLVARYADACNLLEREGHDAVKDKLEILRKACQAAGRPYSAILKTTFGHLANTDHITAQARFGALAALGIDLALVDLPNDLQTHAPLRLLAELDRRYTTANDR